MRMHDKNKKRKEFSNEKQKVTQLFAGLMVTAMVITGIVPSTKAMAATKPVTIKTQKQPNASGGTFTPAEPEENSAED